MILDINDLEYMEAHPEPPDNEDMKYLWLFIAGIVVINLLVATCTRTFN